MAFSFSLPYLLLGIPLGLALLVYAYRKHGRGNRLVVATTFLLKRFAQAAPARQKFIPPPRFFFELLLIALLSAAASGLYQKQDPTQVAIVLDNSLSMMAADPRDPLGNSLLASAKKRAQTILAALPRHAQVTLFSSAPQLRPLTNRPDSPEQALAQVQNINPMYAHDSLDSAIVSLANDERFNRVFVLTDKDAADKNTSSTVEITALRTQSLNNIALSDIRIEPPALGATESTLEVVISSYSSAATTLAVTLEAVSEKTGARQVITKKETVVSPHAQESVAFTVSETDPRLLHVFLASLTKAAARADVISEDNEAWLSLEQRGSDLTLVGPFSPQDLHLDGISALRIRYVGTELSKVNQNESTIFHRVTPDALPRGNALFVLPKSTPLVAVGSEVNDVRITRAASSHPVLTYVQPQRLLLKRATPISPPPWATTLLSSSAGPVAVVGEHNGHRYAMLGFEIFPFSGKEDPTLSIFTLNLLKWISATSLSSGYRPVGARVSGTLLTLTGKPVASAPIVNQPGLYRIENGGRSEVAAFNFFNSEESDTSRLGTISAPGSATKKAVESMSDHSLAHALVCVALVLLLLDLLYGMRRRTSAA